MKLLTPHISLQKSAWGLFWILLASTSAWTIAEAIPYFDFSPYHLFLQEKGELVKDALWRTCFYFHITGGMICLITGLFLFVQPILKKWPAVHRTMGKAYVFTVLVWAGPTGLYMCLFAKGGAPAAIPFTLMGIGWWIFTYMGYRSIRAKKVKDHMGWMARSYAFALSAVSFRLFQLLLFSFGMGDELNYIASMWLSLATSLITGELSASYFTQRKLIPWKRKSNRVEGRSSSIS